MPELLEPATEVPVAEPTDHHAEPLRTMEEIRAESQALGARVRDPDTPAAEKLAARLRLLALMDEMRKHWTEDEALDREMMRSIDSRRPPGHRLFDQDLSEERT